jgi:hypothetical protein
MNPLLDVRRARDAKPLATRELESEKTYSDDLAAASLTVAFAAV